MKLSLAFVAALAVGQAQEDPLNQIHRASVNGAAITNPTVTSIPSDAFSFATFAAKTVQDPATDGPHAKIHPTLANWVSQQPATSAVTLVITFQDDLTIPRFPEPADQTQDAQTQAAAASAQLRSSIQQQRAPAYSALAQEFAQSYGAQVLQTFWLIKAMVVSMPLGAVQAVAARADVLYVEPENAGDAPPNTVADARARINSDPYFNLGDSRGSIGLLDTGLRSTHTLFVGPSHILARFNCDVNGENCTPSTVSNDDCGNHGTSSAAIITGNNNLGNAERGVTASSLRSYRVYPTTPIAGGGECENIGPTPCVCQGLSVRRCGTRFPVFHFPVRSGDCRRNARLRRLRQRHFHGRERGVRRRRSHHRGEWEQRPGAGTVNSPANAHRVIGIGDFDVDTLAQIASQSRGPASQGRYKPDIQTPTNSLTASSLADAGLKVFGGTSGATPYAGGAASLFRNWLRGNNASVDPGQVYAQLILSGQNPWPGFAFDGNTEGAGHAVMGTDGVVWWGKVSVANGQTIDIPLAPSSDFPNTATLLDGALWWPENPDKHNDVDLFLLDNTGAVKAQSISGPSVIERARAAGPAVLGDGWKIRIRGAAVPNGPQTVYWAARAVFR